MKVDHVGVVGPNGDDDLAWHVADCLDRWGVRTTNLGSISSNRFAKAGRPAQVAADLLRQHPIHGWRAEQHLFEAAKSANVDTVITIQSLHPETVRRLAQRGIRVVLWFPDAVSNLGPLWMFDAPYTHVFFKEPVLVQRVNALLRNPISLMHEACNPAVHRPPPETAKRKTIGIIGNLYATRLKLMERLVDDGYTLEVRGNTPPKWSSLFGKPAFTPKGYVRGPAKAEVFRNCGVVLNSMHPAEIEGVNNRLFEATACGAAVLCERRSAVAELFEIDAELAVFGTYAELREQIELLLNDQDRAVRMGDRASARSHAAHSYDARLSEMFRVCGFDQPAQINGVPSHVN